jgi:hypothetical protein
MPCNAAAEEDLERDARGRDCNAGGHDRDVLEQHRERDQHDAQCRQRVEACERRGEECGKRADHGEQPEDCVAGGVVEEDARARLREALEAADQAEQPPDEPPAAGTGELDRAPVARQPDLLPPGDELQRDRIAMISKTCVAPPGTGAAPDESLVTSLVCQAGSANADRPRAPGVSDE